MAKDNLALFEADPGIFLQQFVAIDETWVHHFQLETKTVKTVEASEISCPKKAKSVLHLLGCRSTADGLTLKRLKLSTGHTTLIFWSNYNTKSRRVDMKMLTREALFHQDNASAHKSNVTMKYHLELWIPSTWTPTLLAWFWHPLTTTSSPDWRKSSVIANVARMMTLMMQWISFLGYKMLNSTKHGSVCSTTAGLNVYKYKGTVLKNNSNSHKSVYLRPRTFQSPLVYWMIQWTLLKKIQAGLIPQLADYPTLPGIYLSQSTKVLFISITF